MAGRDSESKLTVIYCPECGRSIVATAWTDTPEALLERHRPDCEGRTADRVNREWIEDES